MDIYELRRFGAGAPPNVREISALHAALLPASPITLLGRRFREHFYYKDLPEMGLIFGAVAYLGGRAVGFVAATHDSNGFMATALARMPLRVAWFVARALLADPRRILAVWETVRIKRDRERSAEGLGKAEILSLGVLPEYRSHSGLNIARDLVQSVMETFQTSGATRVCAVIDADNQPSLRFFEKLGFRLGRARLPGWRRPSVEVVWEAGGTGSNQPPKEESE
jgi:ribosomal protein S18 acetylase RimI-like enzyme